MSTFRAAFRSFFASVHLTLILLAVTVLLAAVGTLVPQQESARTALAQTWPGLASFLGMMQFYDLYHSVWFFLLGLFFFLNLAVCSWVRLPAAWRRFRNPAPPSDADFEGAAARRQFQATSTADAVAATAVAVLGERFRKVRTDRGHDGIVVWAEKGRIGALGPYLVHASLLLLIAGALTGSLFGVEGVVTLGEGETAAAMAVKGGGERPLPFAVRCDRFILEQYDNGMPRTYQSDLVFLKDGREFRRASVRVNAPVAVEGFRFYQASYGLLPDAGARLAYTVRGGRETAVAAAPGEVVALAGGAEAQVLRVEEDLMRMGPAVKLRVSARGRDAVFWVFEQMAAIEAAHPGIARQVPLFDPASFKPYVFRLTGLQETYYTGLQVSRDPGVPVVAAGGMLLLAGVAALLLSGYARAGVRLVEQEGSICLTVAGRGRYTSAVVRDLDGLTERLRRRLETTRREG